jgi:hypothetical protein
LKPRITSNDFLVSAKNILVEEEADHLLTNMTHQIGDHTESLAQSCCPKRACALSAPLSNEESRLITISYFPVDRGATDDLLHGAAIESPFGK